MTQDIISALQGLDPTVIDAISKPEVLEKLSAYVERAKEPVLNKNTEVLGKFASLQEQVKALGGLDTLKTLKDSYDAVEREKQEALANSGNVDALRQQFAYQLAEKDASLTALQQSVIQEKTHSAITKALMDADADAGLLLPHVASRVRSELVDGKVVLSVLDNNGQPMITRDMKQAGLTDLVDEFKSMFPAAFKAKTVSGSGAKTASSISGVTNPWIRETQNFSEQNRIAREDPKLAMALAAVAGKTIKL